MGSHTEKGGIRYGGGSWRWFHAGWPYVTLVAEEGKLTIRVSVLRLWSRSFEFEKGQILMIYAKRGFMNSGIMIEHRRGDYPPYLVFWTFNFKRLRSKLEELGYPVSEVRRWNPR